MNIRILLDMGFSLFLDVNQTVSELKETLLPIKPRPLKLKCYQLDKIDMFVGSWRGSGLFRHV